MGYTYHDATGMPQWQTDDNSKAKEFCGCRKIGTKVVHGADGAWLLCDECLDKLISRLRG